MATRWLFKTEPSVYSFQQLEKEKKTRWDGVANNLALKNLKDIKKGEHIFIYHTGDEKAAVGFASVASAPFPDPKKKDPKLLVVKLKAGKPLQRPVTLEFRDASLRSVLEIVSRHSGLNFVFDRDVRPDLRTTVFVRDTPIEEAIRMVLLTSQLERRVLNENTILIYPDTPAKTREYRELVMKSFYLTNADAKQTANMLRALVKTRDLYIDEKLNLLVIRDTPEGREADAILRKCVHCGFCTATCPTYQLEGNELDGPRGRIYLIKQMLERDAPATAESGSE